MLLRILDTSLLENLLTSKGVKRWKISGCNIQANIPWQEVIGVGKGEIKDRECAIIAVQCFNTASSLNLFWNTKAKPDQTKPNFNGVYSRNNLPKIKYGAYVIDFDDYKSIGTHLISFSANGDNGSASYNETYFNNFGVE